MSLITAVRRRSAAALAATAVVAASGLLVAAPAVAGAEPAAPSLSVFLADGTTPYQGQEVADGDTLVVKGAGFDPASNVGGYGAPIPNTLPQGTYLIFGNFAADWKPSAGAKASARKAGSQQWVLAEAVLDQIPNDKGYQDAVRAAWVPLGPDGTFSAGVTVDTSNGTVDGGTWGIYTYAAGGAVNAAQEIGVPVTVATDAHPAVTVTPTTLDPTADNTLDIVGSGFSGPGAQYGVYVLVGAQSNWHGEGPLPADGWVKQAWVQPQNVTDGGFTTSIDIPANTLTPGVAYQVATSAAHGLSATDRSLDTFTPIALATGTPSTTTTVTSTSTKTSAPTTSTSSPTTTSTRTTSTKATSTKATTSPNKTTSSQATTTSAPTEQELADGTLRWGVKTSFRDYVVGPVAQGEIATSGGATFDGKQVSFGSAKGTVATGSLTATVSGSVRFTGHDMGSGPLLDLTLSHLAITVTGTSGALIADVHSRSMQTGEFTDLTGVTLATLNLAGHPMTITGNTVALREVPATLTAEGAVAFGGFYVAGDDLDPVGFTGQLRAEDDGTTSGDPATTATSTATTSSRNGASSTLGSNSTGTATGTPSGESSTTGTASVSSGSVGVGGTLKLRAEGFRPGEKATIHLHSDPVLLDTVTADAAGVVTATVTIPPDTPAGAHTVVITGLDSGHRAAAAVTVTAADSHGPSAVTGGSLSWGVLASFRSYISGSIAQGSWETSGGATDSAGTFTFSVATGSYDSDAGRLTVSFAGSVRFTGHDMGSGPLLDLTISGLRLAASGDSGALYADIRSRDMNDPSTWLQVSGVRLADLDLAGAGLAPVGGRIVLSGIPVTLTADGAAGFAGFYRAGQQMDPLDLALTVEAADAGAGTSTGDAGAQTDDSDLASTGVPTVSLVALAAALLIAGGLALAVTRRRTVPRRAH